MSYYQHSNYFFGNGQMTPHYYPWSQPPYQQEWAGVSQQDRDNSPILISPSKSTVEDSDHDSSVTEPNFS